MNRVYQLERMEPWIGVGDHFRREQIGVYQMLVYCHVVPLLSLHQRLSPDDQLPSTVTTQAFPSKPEAPPPIVSTTATRLIRSRALARRKQR